MAPSAGYRILLASSRDGMTRAYSVRPDGSRLTPLLPRGRALEPVALSGDGGTIAYRDLNGIYVSRADGTGLRRLVRGAIYGAALSRDGRLLAFATLDRRERSAISIVGTNGRGRRRVTSGPSAGGPDWSPDGKALVFMAGIDDERQAIVVQPLHGTRRVLVRGDLVGDPKWSPDGRWVAYTTTNRSSLHVVHPNGLRRHRVARDATTFSWSPDGRSLAFAGYPFLGPRRGYGEPDLGVVGVDGRGLRRRRLGIQAGAPTWSPDGRQLILAGRVGDDADQIWVVGRNGRALRRVTREGWNSLVGWTRLAPVLPPAPPVPPTEHVIGTDTVATLAPVADISADGQRVAFVVKATATDCDHIAVWTPATKAIRRFRLPAACASASAGEGVYEVELAGSRAAWVSYACGNICEFILKSAMLDRPRPLWLTLNSREHSEPFWDYHLRGDGDLLVFDDGSRLVRIGAGRERCQRHGDIRTSICATVRLGAHAAPADSVSGQLIAIREADAVAVVDEQGKIVRVFPFARGELSAARLDGGHLIVARANVIESYDVATGTLELWRALPTGCRLVDVDRGIAVLVRADSIILLRLADDRSLTVAPGSGPIFADLEPTGLYYSYGVDKGGRVVFIPRSDLLRQLG
jgi:hypothetical protein